MTGTGVVELRAEGERYLAVAKADRSGRKVGQVLDQPGQRLMLMAFTAGSGLPEHDSPPAATLHVLRGRARLVAGERSWSLGEGDLVAIPQARHTVEAEEDTIALLSMTTVAVG